MNKTRIMLLVFAAICLSLVLSTCSSPSFSPRQVAFNIQGTVTEAENGMPIEGAQAGIMSLGSFSCPQLTESNGDFYIGNCVISPAVYGFTNLKIYKTGYAVQYVNLEMTSSLQTFNIALEQETQ